MAWMGDGPGAGGLLRRGTISGVQTLGLALVAKQAREGKHMHERGCPSRSARETTRARGREKRNGPCAGLFLSGAGRGQGFSGTRSWRVPRRAVAQRCLPCIHASCQHCHLGPQRTLDSQQKQRRRNIEDPNPPPEPMSIPIGQQHRARAETRFSYSSITYRGTTGPLPPPASQIVPEILPFSVPG